MPNLHFPDWTSLSPDQRGEEAQRCRARLAELGTRLNAVVSVAAPPAGAFASGTAPLGGLPYVAKDMFDRVGRHAGWGGVRPQGPSPAASAEILNRLDAAGAVEVAVSTMTELAYEPSGYNGVRGRTLNPWHPDVVSGGSSSGSAALVAAGAAVLGLGSDTGGSVRIPASCCGVTGLKPTHGAVPDSGSMALAPSLDTVGIFARSAAELQLVWPVVSGAAPADERPVTTAVVLAEWIQEATPGVRRAAEAGIEALRAAGVAIGSVGSTGGVDEIDRHTLLVMQAESARAHRPAAYPDGRLSPSLRRRLTKGEEIGEAALADSLGQRPRLLAGFLDWIGEADVALLPVLPFETPLASQADPENPAFEPRVLYRMSSFTRFVNLLGLPALSLPCGFDQRGVPIGLQIIGRRHRERQLLALAARVQAVSDWHGRIPPALSQAG